MNRPFLTCGLLLIGAGRLLAQDSGVPARLSLEEALRIAEARNPHLVVARLGIAASEADVLGAGKRPNPVLTLNSEGIPLSQQNRPPFFDNQELAFAVEQEFELGGRRRLRTDQAQRGVEASRASARDAFRQLRFEVRRAYMQVVLATADDAVARTTLDQIDKVLALNRTRYQQGELSGVELRRLQVERFRFADDAFVAELALKNARSGLLSILNLRPLDQAFWTPPAGNGSAPRPGSGCSERSARLPSRSARASSAISARMDFWSRSASLFRSSIGTRRALRGPMPNGNRLWRDRPPSKHRCRSTCRKR
jgi:outer membrane protein TolC